VKLSEKKFWQFFKTWRQNVVLANCMVPVYVSENDVKTTSNVNLNTTQDGIIIVDFIISLI
jgi:hypothetical protein